MIIPTLNEGDYLPAVLHALGRQTFRDFDVWVVDGGSQDGTIAEALRSGTRVIVRKSNIAEARNLGANSTSAPFLVFLDADTIVPPEFLEIAIDELKERLARFLVGRPEPLETSFVGRVGYFLGWGLCRAGLTNPCYMGVAVRREVFEEVGGFDERLVYNEDLDLLHRVRTVTRPMFPRHLVSFNSTRRWIGKGGGGRIEPLVIFARILEYFLLRRSRESYPIYHSREK